MRVIKLLERLVLFLGVVFLVLLILLASVFYIVKHLRIKEIVEGEIEQSLGIKVDIKKINFSPLLVHIVASDITIHNPKGFVEDELAYIKSIHLTFDPLEAITRKKPNIYLFVLDLERLNIIKNSDGRVNIKEIIHANKTGPPKDEKTKEHFYFDVLVLSVGEVDYTEYTASGKREHKYPIGLKNAAFIGLKDEDALVKTVIYRALENTDIGKLIGLTVVPVITQITDTVDSAWGTARTGAKGAWEIATLPFQLLFGKTDK